MNSSQFSIKNIIIFANTVNLIDHVYLRRALFIITDAFVLLVKFVIEL